MMLMSEGTTKNTLLERATINFAIVALVSLLGACATTISPQAENKAQQRSSVELLVTELSK
jgi:hypothetical protein